MQSGRYYCLCLSGGPGLVYVSLGTVPINLMWHLETFGHESGTVIKSSDNNGGDKNSSIISIKIKG